MPVRSLNSSVLKWPDRDQVDASVRKWAKAVTARRNDVRRIGYYGSYARGDWGVGSDLDLVVVLASSGEPPLDRNLQFDLTELPIPAEVVVFTEAEWNALDPSKRFHRTLQEETEWVFDR